MLGNTGHEVGTVGLDAYKGWCAFGAAGDPRATAVSGARWFVVVKGGERDVMGVSV